jgi:hypothetical protein
LSDAAYAGSCAAAGAADGRRQVNGTVRGYGDTGMQQRLKIEVGWTRFHSSHDGVAGSDLIDPCVCVARGQRSAFFAALPRDGCRVAALSIIVMAKRRRRRRLDGSWAITSRHTNRAWTLDWPSWPCWQAHCVWLDSRLPASPSASPCQPRYYSTYPTSRPTHARNQGASSRALIAGQHVGRSQLPRGLPLLF